MGTETLLALTRQSVDSSGQVIIIVSSVSVIISSSHILLSDVIVRACTKNIIQSKAKN